MNFTAREIAQILNGTVDGNPDVTVHSPGRIEDAQEGQLTFYSNPKYEKYLYNTKASVVLIAEDFQPSTPIEATLIIVKDVYQALSKLYALIAEKEDSFTVGVSELAYIDQEAVISTDCSIGHFTVIEKGAKVGKNCRIYPQVYIGPNVEIGDEVVLYPGVRIMHNCIIKNRVKIHSNSSIGTDGFGFVTDEKGRFQKIQQLGNVVIEENVEIGSNVSIDRASIGSTIIKAGAKLDNLIQIAHNVEIGENTAMAAQSGVAGSTKIGNNVLVGGQAGIVGHLTIGDKTMIQAQSGVSKSTKEGEKLYGYPAINYNSYLKSYVLFRQLPQMHEKINQLRKEIDKLKKGLGK